MPRPVRPTDSARAPRTGTRRSRGPVAALVVLGLLATTAATVPSSGANFSARTVSPGSGVTAAADWVAPTVAVTDPGSPLRGTVPLAATATDSGAGVRTVQVQVAPNAGDGSSYATVCTTTTAPYSCSWATTGLADGAYKVRATATDKADNAATSAVVSNRVVDNTAPTATLQDPGTTLHAGDVALSATAADATSGVAKVTFQRAAAGTTTWTDVCAATSAPYGCTWSATAGTYDLRAVVVDRAGNTATTGTLRRQVVDPHPFGVRPLHTINAGTPGRIDQGDRLVLTYSEPLALDSIVPGWSTGRSPQFAVRVRTPAAISGGADDTLDFVGTDGSVTAALGSINLGDNGYARVALGWLSAGTLRATATAVGTTNADGTFTVTITFGALSGTAPTTVSTTNTMVWTPSTSVRDLTGQSGLTTAVTQSPGAVNF
ncbi:Ig-like domain-containing protein [Patulibacter americanus]|uniref:Ig-like domain-containing protein n=1 Tax=Patulibacter americanus TaxID=588672 RepID=UPI0003B359CF|nr:Ig-like domain-containing protein [Patulibacter americanus]